MTISHYTLRFPDRSTAQAAATALGFWDTEKDRLKTDGQGQDPDGSWFGWSIVECGQDPVDPARPGTYDAEGNEITPPGRFSGFYVNIVGQLPPAAMAYLAPEPYGAVPPLFAGSEPDGQ